MDNNNKIFVPKKIKVGYQTRGGTFTGQLAYVIYYDEKGNLRKETSWEQWRNKKIEPNDYENVPTAGFVFNKKAGGERNHWNTRQTTCRVFDPRGFEFEITMENLLYILENMDCIKGKGLVGEMVYGWIGGNHVLIPVDSPDYQEIEAFNQAISNPMRLKGKDLIPGAIYATRTKDHLCYLGYMETFKTWGEYEAEGKKYVFQVYPPDYNYVGNYSYETLASPGTIVKVEQDFPVHDYAMLMDWLERSPFVHPRERIDYLEYDKEILEKLLREHPSVPFVLKNNGVFSNVIGRLSHDNEMVYIQDDFRHRAQGWRSELRKPLAELMDSTYTIYKRVPILNNGKTEKVAEFYPY